MNTNKRIYRQINRAVEILRKEAPRNEKRAKLLKHPERRTTDNLKKNAIKLEYIGNGVYKLWVDESIAPYMPYTNEPWVSPKWGGTPNPNENWFGNAERVIVEKISKTLKGKYKKIKE